MLIYEPGMVIQKSDAALLVNTVNTVGTMGKGLALDIKKAFPEVMARYKQACSEGKLAPGTFQILPTKDGRHVLNLATKQEWRNPSQYDWVGSGLVYLNRYLTQHSGKFPSVAMPLPGCGNGGLEAARVQQMIRTYLHGAVQAGVRISVAAAPTEPIADQIFFAGVGSRETPRPILSLMSEIGAMLTEEGLRLRSGGAIGADSAFWEGAREADPSGMEIFLPKPKRHIPDGITASSPVFDRLALNFHPHPSGIRPDPDNPDDKRHYFLKLMSRNGNQIFGLDFRVPTNVVVCWTVDGQAGGGTGQAIRLAQSVGIPVIDLGRPELSGISAEDIRAMALGLVAEFRQSRGLPIAQREPAPSLC